MSTFKSLLVQAQKTIRYTSILYLFILFLFLLILPVYAEKQAPDRKEISREQAWEIVKKEILKDTLKDKAVYVSREPLNAKDTIKSWEKTYRVPDDFKHCWFFFVDDQYGANWQHHCRYVFVDVGTGKFEVIESLTPPDTMKDIKQIYPGK